MIAVAESPAQTNLIIHRLFEAGITDCPSRSCCLVIYELARKIAKGAGGQNDASWQGSIAALAADSMVSTSTVKSALRWLYDRRFIERLSQPKKQADDGTWTQSPTIYKANAAFLRIVRFFTSGQNLGHSGNRVNNNTYPTDPTDTKTVGTKGARPIGPGQARTGRASGDDTAPKNSTPLTKRQPPVNASYARQGSSVSRIGFSTLPVEIDEASELMSCGISALGGTVPEQTDVETKIDVIADLIEQTEAGIKIDEYRKAVKLRGVWAALAALSTMIKNLTHTRPEKKIRNPERYFGKIVYYPGDDFGRALDAVSETIRGHAAAAAAELHPVSASTPEIEFINNAHRWFDEDLDDAGRREIIERFGYGSSGSRRRTSVMIEDAYRSFLNGLNR